MSSPPLIIPELSLVVLIGASSSGKSTFARRHFKPTEILSSDACRALIADDENELSATKDAFELLRFIAGKRLAAERMTVIDATSVRTEDRAPLVELAREYHCLPVAIVLNTAEKICQERNAQRRERQLPPHVIRNHIGALRRDLRHLKREGFRHIHILDTPAEADAAAIQRQPLWNNRRQDPGPFDIVGDVHGCYDELVELLTKLGYTIEPADDGSFGVRVTPPAGRKVVFVGDLVDRGPGVVAALRLAMSMCAAGTALCVPGNHDVKLLRKLRGKDVQISHGLAESLKQLEAESPAFRAQVAEFIDGLVSHYVFDAGGLVVAHAGLREEMHGRGSGRVREFCLFGETTGETDDFGLPVRYNWAADYRGRATVVYGHTPVPEPEWLNGTINVDTGCVFGGKLTALRYPERELISVAARKTYAEPRRPFLTENGAAPSAQQAHDDVLDLGDLPGKRVVSTRLNGGVTLTAAQCAAALEASSRFAVDPRWLIYVPPTMSPCATSARDGLLEHPAEAFAYYREHGQPRVICEEKHMGSRAVMIACQSADAARRRFGIDTGETGVIYTRTGRRFFDDAQVEAELLRRVAQAAVAAGLWDELQSDWVCLDCELMPWSVKAQSLLREQYAAVGAAARAGLAAAAREFESVAARLGTASPAVASSGGGLDAESGGSRALQAADIRDMLHERAVMADQFTAAYRRYCWPVASIADLRLAPFHLLASEGRVHLQRDHTWHMDTLARLCAADAGAPGVLRATPYRVVDLTDAASEAAATAWWTDLTDRGGEGMVVKPLDFIARDARGLLQPAVKCRGREYLRIIYGPDYTRPEHLERLRTRGLGRKRSLALREFAVGVEGLERFVRREPLYRVHECALGVLALETETTDPRL